MKIVFSTDFAENGLHIILIKQIMEAYVKFENH